MNLSEFKAWFEGFTENIKGAPTKDQWHRITKRVKEIQSVPTSYPIFVDHYIHHYPHYPLYYSLNGVASSNTISLQNLSSCNMAGAISQNTASLEWNPEGAFRGLGRAEAQAMN